MSRSLRYLLTAQLACISFSSEPREEVVSRYESGKREVVMKFIGSGTSEVMVSKLRYSEYGDTLLLESYNQSGLRHGKWIKNDVEWELWERSYTDGKRDGVWREYYWAGMYQKYDSKNEVVNVKEERVYRDDLTLESTKFYKDGKVKERAKYTDGKLDGKLYKYCPDTGVVNEEIYAEGKRHGIWKLYSCSGEIDSQQSYIQDKRDGEWIDYRDGRVSSTRIYTEGKKEGVWMDFYHNGMISSVTEYRNDKVVTEEAVYTDGKIWSGEVRTERMSSNYLDEIIEEGSYREGKKHGHWRYFLIDDPFEYLQRVEYWTEGRMEWKLSYDRADYQEKWTFYNDDRSIARRDTYDGDGNLTQRRERVYRRDESGAVVGFTVIESRYSSGKLIDSKTYDEYNNPIE